MPPSLARQLAFASAFAFAWYLHWLDGGEITHSVVWLPSGIAIAGVWLLGPRVLWIVLLAVLLQRLSVGTRLTPAVFAALGAAGEALLGREVLRRFGARPDFARLRDVMTLFAATATAPLVSVTFSALARAVIGYGPEISGYDGWWRMNALGILIVVPLVATWTSAPRRALAPHRLLDAVAIASAAQVLLTAGMVLLPPTTTTIGLLYAVLPLSLFAALRAGQRGTTLSASTGALVIYLLASHGFGPFQLAPVAERYTSVQMFELSLLAIPLVFGSLVAERRDSAQQWIRSEGLRAALLNVLPDIVYRIRADGTVLDAVAPDGVTLPTPSERLIGQRIDAITAPDLAARMLTAIRDALANGRSQPIEYVLQTSGTAAVREARFVRLGGDEVLGLVRDMTDRAAAERMLALQAQVLERIATGRPMAEGFAVLAAGIEAAVRHGRSSVLLLRGRRLHVAYAAALPRAYNEAIDGLTIGPGVGTCGIAAHDNRTVVTADIATDPAWQPFREQALGAGLHACWSVPIRSSSGAVLGTFAVYHDHPRHPSAGETSVVERAALLAAIAIEREQREQLLTSIQQHVAEGLFRAAPGHGVTYCNAAFAAMFGYRSPTELLTAMREDATLPPAHRAALDGLCRARQPDAAHEVALHRRDGSEFWALVSSTLVPDDAGGEAYVGAVADVSTRRALEQQLRQAQKMEAVGKLAGGVAHDFNNLLTAITGYAESLEESLPPGDPRRADVRGVFDAARRASGLTRQLLAFSRQQVLTPRVLDLGAVVRDLRSLITGLLGAQIELRLDVAQGVPVRVDRTQIEQVMLNLVVNARDAMPAGGRLTIGTRVLDAEPAAAAGGADRHVLLWVRDTGIGMDAVSRAHAFDPFFTTKAPGKGTGLGLSTVYGIVRQSGGNAWIDSEPGVGTTVWIRLPVANEAVEDEPEPSTTAAPATAATILLVEDEPMVRELVHRALTRAGHHVLLADCGDAALERSSSHDGDVHLLITDVVMPGLDGPALAARLVGERPGLPVLFVSGFTGDDRDLALGPHARLLHKPFTVPALLAAVNGLLPTNAS